MRPGASTTGRSPGSARTRSIFQINGAGHEAVQAAAVMCLRPGHDWFFLYYRDRALAYGLGVSAKDMFLGSVGSCLDPATGGRQMPTHWTSPELNIFACSSTTGTQFLQAVGVAEGVLRAEQGGLLEELGIHRDTVVLATSGDGTCAEGEFWEAINNAVNLQAARALPDPGQRLRHLHAHLGAVRRERTWRRCSRAGSPMGCWSSTRWTAAILWPATSPSSTRPATSGSARGRPWCARR